MSAKKKKRGEREAENGQDPPDESDKTDGELTRKPSKSGSSLRLPAIIGMSAGALLVGVGGFFAVKSKIISDDVSNSPGFDPALEKKGRSAERNSYIFGGVGAAVLVGGAVLYVLGNKKKSKESSLTLVPAISGDSVGAFAYGEF